MGKQLFGQAYQTWIEGDLDGAQTLFEQLAQECPSSPAGQQALAFAVRCYDKSKDADGADSYLERIIKEKSTSVLSDLAMSIKVDRLARLGKYDEAVCAAEQLLNSATDRMLRKYALYDLATLLYHFLNDKHNGEIDG
jgi:outer membrane protein assembly factor BamD (BamD/ComL family)